MVISKSEAAKNLLSSKDLASRWKYTSVSAVEKRRKYDRSFPYPLLMIDGRYYVYWLPDIIAYEKLRPGLGDEIKPTDKQKKSGKIYRRTNEKLREIHSTMSSHLTNKTISNPNLFPLISFPVERSLG